MDTILRGTDGRLCCLKAGFNSKPSDSPITVYYDQQRFISATICDPKAGFRFLVMKGDAFNWLD